MNSPQTLKARRALAALLLFPLIALSLHSRVAFADEMMAMEHRLRLLERQLESRSELETHQLIQALQEEVMMLRGELEEANASIEQLKQSQRQLYLDLDRRLSLKNGTESKDSLALNKEPVIFSQTPVFEASNETLSAKQELAQTEVSEILPADELGHYQAAYALLAKKDYVASTFRFRDYLKRFPEGKHAPNVHYWLGEIYLLQKQPEQALQAFKTVVENYSKHQKVGDALLKMGYAHDALGDTGKATEIFKQVKNTYHGTGLARLAEMQLSRLKAIQ